MADPALTRRSGVLADWNDERGFGFVLPSDGSRKVFVHISEFPKDAPRPADGDELAFAVGPGSDGRSQALGVEVLHSTRETRKALEALAAAEAAHAERQRAPISWIPIYVVPLFAILFVLIAVYWDLPLWVMVLYPLMSGATFLMYYLDKRAAMDAEWRVREMTLQIAALLGGWPGAILAQQLLRHKNRKAAFQGAFWCLVVLNIAVLLIIVWYQGPMAEFVQSLSDWLSGG